MAGRCRCWAGSCWRCTGRGDGGGAAAGDAVPGVPGLAGPPGHRRGARPPGHGHWPGWRNRPGWHPAPTGPRLPVRPQNLVTELPAGLAAALEQHARAQAVTMNTVLQAAWGLLAGALTGRDDVVFGTVVAGRPPELPGVETMLGLFINTVPVRVRLDPAVTVGSCGPGCRTSRHSCWPTTIWAWRRSSGPPGRARSSTPWSSTRTTPATPPGWPARTPARTRAGHRRRRARRRALSAVADGDAGERLRLRLSYRPDLFDRGRGEQIAGPAGAGAGAGGR